MWWRLKEDLHDEARSQIRDFERYRKRLYDENQRRLRRSIGSPRMEVVQRPAVWSSDPGFDPYHVRAHLGSISHSVTRSLRSGEYTPHRAAGFRVPKVGGGTRLVSSYPIVDSLISNRLFRSLLEKNRPRLSARSYAYRADLGPHDAIMHIQAEWRVEQRVFIAEYDFSKFFDRISHDHIWKTIDALGLMMTDMEERLLRAFLTSPEPYVGDQWKSEIASPRMVGVPQGTSISLLLANIAASPLDRALERLGVGFVRYADDTLIWSRDYSAICDAVQELHTAAEQIGSPVNQEKSEGVRLLVPPSTKNAELRSTSRVEYLGHSLGLRELQMKKTVVEKIKKHIQDLLYNNLLREPISGTQNPLRLTHVDRDYVTFVWQLRRYLYGPLSEGQVRRFLQGSIPPMTFQGIMSFFPLVDNDESLRELDAWIVTQTWLALRKRAMLLARLAVPRPEPWSRSRDELVSLVVKSSRPVGTSRRTLRTVDLRLPSITRVASVVRRAVTTHGTGVVGSGSALYLYAK